MCRTRRTTRLSEFAVVWLLTGAWAPSAFASTWAVVSAQPFDAPANGQEIVMFEGSLARVITATLHDAVTFEGTGGHSLAFLGADGFRLRVGRHQIPGAFVFVQFEGPGGVGWCVEGVLTVHELELSSTEDAFTKFAADFNGVCVRPDRTDRAWYSAAGRFNSDVPYDNATLSSVPGADLIWRAAPAPPTVDGALWASRLTGSAIEYGRRIQRDVGDPNWQIVGTADFNADGFSDLVFQHADGRIAFWFLRRTTVMGMASAVPERVDDVDWRVVAIADIDRDRHPDLIWQHRTDGRLAVWYMRGTRLVRGASFGPGQVSDPQWQIMTAGDMNRDGSADLLWRHLGDGRVSVWLMRRDVMLSGSLLTPSTVELSWRLRGVTDANRDGWLDLVWDRGSGGGAAIWFMLRTQMMSAELITPAVQRSGQGEVLWEVAAAR